MSGAAPAGTTLTLPIDVADMLSWLPVFFGPIWPFVAVAGGLILTVAIVGLIMFAVKKIKTAGAH